MDDLGDAISRLFKYNARRCYWMDESIVELCHGIIDGHAHDKYVFWERCIDGAECWVRDCCELSTWESVDYADDINWSGGGSIDEIVSNYWDRYFDIVGRTNVDTSIISLLDQYGEIPIGRNSKYI